MIKRLWDNGTARLTLIIVAAFVVCAAAFFAAYFLPFGRISFGQSASIATVPTMATNTIEVPPLPPPVPAHIKTPDSVRAVYLSSWAAGSEKFRKPFFDIIDSTEINAVVIDVKDYTGKISFKVNDTELQKVGASEDRIPDIDEFIKALHEKNIYVIGRISSFQDSYLINIHPDWAVKTEGGAIWKDYKGVKWLDAGAKPVWDYIVMIGKEAYSRGFDELNFDYIRFPSDGNLKDISYTWGEGRTRQQTMKAFYEYIHEQFKSTGIPISADFFGLTTSASDDLGIGQVLEDALANFDYVSPMVYPSHFGKGYNGYPKPAEHPYGVIKTSMDRAAIRAVDASTTPAKLRPWLQAFDLGAIYTPEMVRAQIQATYDVGLNSWMLWDAGSLYDKNDLRPKGEEPVVATSTAYMAHEQFLKAQELMREQALLASSTVTTASSTCDSALTCN